MATARRQIRTSFAPGFYSNDHATYFVTEKGSIYLVGHDDIHESEMPLGRTELPADVLPADFAPEVFADVLARI